MHKNVAERFGRHSKVKTTTSPSHVEISPSSRPNSECHVSRPPRLSEGDTSLSVGRQMPERPSFGLSVSRFRCFYDGYTARGIHGSPADSDGRFESLMSFALPISSPLRGHFRCSSSGLPKLHSSFEVAPTNELGEKIGPRRKGKGDRQEGCNHGVPH